MWMCVTCCYNRQIQTFLLESKLSWENPPLTGQIKGDWSSLLTGKELDGTTIGLKLSMKSYLKAQAITGTQK